MQDSKNMKEIYKQNQEIITAIAKQVKTLCINDEEYRRLESIMENNFNLRYDIRNSFQKDANRGSADGKIYADAKQCYDVDNAAFKKAMRRYSNSPVVIDNLKEKIEKLKNKNDLFSKATLAKLEAALEYEVNFFQDITVRLQRDRAAKELWGYEGHEKYPNLMHEIAKERIVEKYLFPLLDSAVENNPTLVYGTEIDCKVFAYKMIYAKLDEKYYDAMSHHLPEHSSKNSTPTLG